MMNKKSTRILILIYSFIFLAMLVMTSLTPMLADDFSYSFSKADGQRIDSVQDVVQSLIAHRVKVNGRMISHGLAMLFLMAPKGIFNVLNAGNAILLLWLMSRFFPHQKKENTIWLVLCTVFLLWLFMPVFGQVFLWLDGSLNYSWALSSVLLFLYPFYAEFMDKENALRRKPPIQGLFLLISFVAGAYSENASCAGLFMAFCFCFGIWKQKRIIPWYLKIGVIAAALGFLFLMTAPAESGRAAEKNMLGIAKNIQRVFEAPKDTLLILYCLFAVLLTISVLSQVNKRTVWASIILFCGSVVSVIVFVFAVYFPWRSLCATTILLILACMLLLRESWNYSKFSVPVLTAILAVNFAFSFVLGIGDIAVLFMEGRKREATILAGVEQGIDPVEVPQYSSNTKYAACYLLPDVYEDPAQWPNYDIAAYYGAGAIVGLPPVENFGD